MSYTETDVIAERQEFNKAKQKAKYVIDMVLEEAVSNDAGIYLPNYDEVEKEVALMLM